MKKDDKVEFIPIADDEYIKKFSRRWDQYTPADKVFLRYSYAMRRKFKEMCTQGLIQIPTTKKSIK